MKEIHRTLDDPRMWDEFFLNEDKFEAEKQRVTGGSNEIRFLPNYKFDEEGRLHIEDHSGIKDYDIVKEIEGWMNRAAKVGINSVCQKSQRGAMVVRDNKVLSEAYNGPASLMVCNPCLRQDIHDNKNFEICPGLHAEGTAIERALITTKGDSLHGARLYYVKTRNGKIIPSGDYACTKCSEKILKFGISEIVLWHKDALLKDEQIFQDPNAFDDENPDNPFPTIGLQTAHFVIYSAGILNRLAKQYVSPQSSCKQLAC